MNPASTSFILGYHGCDRTVADRVLSGKAALTPSHNDYDWLGDGVYFWEHNAHRAHDFASAVSRRPRHAGQQIRTPTVLGAVIDLGFCLNLLDGQFIPLVQQSHRGLVEDARMNGLALPENLGGADLLRRNLDCAVLRFLHREREEQGLDPFDTVRAAFVEGDRLYDNAGFAAKNHIQVCVRQAACIKGYFRPLDQAGRPIVFR